MDIFFQDPSEIPLPPEEVRIRALSADLYPDGRRVLVQVEVDPFQRRPNVDITLTSPLGEERASTSILESPVRKMEMTLHLRGAPPLGEYRVLAELFYLVEEPGDEDQPAASDQPEADPSTTLRMHPERSRREPELEGGQSSPEQPVRLSRQVTDRAETTFLLQE